MATTARTGAARGSTERSIPSRSTLVPTLGFAGGALLAAVALIGFERTGSPGAALVVGTFRWLGPVALVTVLLLVATAALTLLLSSTNPETAAWEEPLLPEPRLPAIRGRATLISLVSLEAGAGGSGVAFNLALLIAVEGQRLVDGGAWQRPRPLCLLSEGPLTEAFGLDPKLLRRHIEQHSGRIAEEVIDLAWRHHSGCELLCLPRGLIDRHRLRLLRLAVERHYDAIVVDAGAHDQWLREAAEDVSDALLLIGLSTEASMAAAAEAAERAGLRHLLPRTALVLNRIRQRSIDLRGLQPFEYQACIAEDPLIAANSRASAWSLRPESSAGRTLHRVADRLLPDLFGRAPDAA